ncbi:MAG: hypothetical protein P8Y00_11495, partial [Deltaproteobacteria bacterium]
MAQLVNIAEVTPYEESPQPYPSSHLEYLIQKRVISENGLKRAMATADRKGGSVESALLKQMNVRKEVVGRTIAEYYNTEYIPFDPHYPAPGEILSKLNPNYLKKNRWVPLCKEEGALRVLIDDPRSFSRIHDI